MPVLELAERSDVPDFGRPLPTDDQHVVVFLTLGAVLGVFPGAVEADVYDPAAAAVDLRADTAVVLANADFPAGDVPLHHDLGDLGVLGDLGAVAGLKHGVDVLAGGRG